MEGMFTPTLDWGNERLDVAVVDRQGVGDRRGGHAGGLVLIGRFTVWGRQFWRITGDYFKGPRASRSGCGSRRCCCR